MKLKISIWGSGSAINLGSIKNEAECKKLKEKIESDDYDFDDFQDADTSDLDILIALSPSDAMISVEKDGKKLYEKSLDKLPFKCFAFKSQNVCVPFLWKAEQTLKGVWFDYDLDVKKRKEPTADEIEKLLIDNLEVTVNHTYRTKPCKNGDWTHPSFMHDEISSVYWKADKQDEEKEYGEFMYYDASSLQYGFYCRLDVVD